MIKESDWKKFKKLKEVALDRFCAETLAECSSVIEKEGTSNHSKYLALYQAIHGADRRLASLFDDHSRSKAPMQLMMIRSAGLVRDSELESLSEDFRKATEPPRDNA
jgi:hypothetical protein